MSNGHNAATASAGSLPMQFGIGILKQVLAELLSLGEGRAEAKVAGNLHKGGHDLPGTPTDADRQQFMRHCTRQFFKVTVLSGGAADVGRDFFAPRLAPSITPQLVAGVTTKQAVHLVGAALVADIQGIAGT